LVSATGKFGTSPRRFPRKLVDERLTVTVDRDGESVSIAGRCTMIGQGGLGAVLAGELQQGDHATISLKLSANGEPLQLNARLVNKQGFRHGFEFVKLTGDQRRAIRRLIEPPQE
jgi:hypothetical protein